MRRMLSSAGLAEADAPAIEDERLRDHGDSPTWPRPIADASRGRSALGGVRKRAPARVRPLLAQNFATEAEAVGAIRLKAR